MKIKNVSLLTLLSTLVILLACGGGGMAEEASPEPVAEAETTPVEEQSSSTPAMLGGGKATEVHPGNGGSPHVKVDWMIQGANISITYGRPYLKGRIVGESVPPMESGIWRLGADEATTLNTDKDLMIGGKHVPAGEYTLWAGHMGNEFHLIVNNQTGQWGTNHDASQDLHHIAMETGELSTPADQLTLSVDEDTLSFDWGALTASVPIMIH
tara:strand:+ start:1084 stop:1719 length:636 start_codon:yes stop_codon:yes gene_type:complete